MSKSTIDALRGEFKHEAGVTRRLFERVPEDRLGWKPHEKSMTLSRLAGHVAELPQWGRSIFTSEGHDLSQRPDWYRPGIAESVADLLALHDACVAEFEDATRDVGDEEAQVRWTLRRGERVIFEMSRAAAARSFVLNHVVHHRGQLSVYLRLLDVPLPPIYGPTADSPGFG